MLADPVAQRAALNVVIFVVINVPLTVLLGLVLAAALNQALPLRVLPRVLFRAIRGGERGADPVWLWMFSRDGIVNQVMGPLAPDPSWLVNRFWAMPIIAFRHLEAARLLRLLYLAAMQNIPTSCTRPPRSTGPGPPEVPLGDRTRGPANDDLGGDRGVHRGQLLHRALPANRWRRAQRASMSPVLLMYQKGIEQGMPDRCRYRRDARRVGHDFVGHHLPVQGGIDGGVDPISPRPGPRSPRAAAGRHQPPAPPPAADVSPAGRVLSLVLLLIGALVFLFPFWYMVVGASGPARPHRRRCLPDPSTLRVDNFIAINERLNLLVTLRNSLIFTLGVIVSTSFSGCSPAMPSPS